MKFTINARVTRTTKCREGFYLLVNGQRIRFSAKKAAIEAIDGLIGMQTFQVVTVREYANRNRSKIKRLQPREKS